MNDRILITIQWIVILALIFSVLLLKSHLTPKECQDCPECHCELRCPDFECSLKDDDIVYWEREFSRKEIDAMFEQEKNESIKWDLQ